MKPKISCVRLIFLFTLFTTTNSFSQEWNWRWAKSCTSLQGDIHIANTFIDFENNIFSIVPYHSVVYIEDTILLGMVNSYALAKYNASGNFINAMRFAGDNMSEPLSIVGDKSMNLYVGGAFANVMYINDSLFHKSDGSSIYQPEVFLVKLDSDYNIKWYGMISDPYSDYFKGVAISEDGSIYISTYHYANVGYTEVNYFDQVISEPFNTPMSTIVKLDTNFNIQWIKEIRSEYLGTEAEELFIGDDNLIYLSGGGYAHFYIDDDTIYHPVFPNGTEATFKEFLLSFNEDGELQKGFYFNWDIGIGYQGLEIDASSNLCIAGTIHDTAVIGQDTIIVPDGLFYSVVGKFNQSLEPVWYEAIDETQTQGVFFSRIDLVNDNLFVCGGGMGNFQIADTAFSLGNFWEGFVCEFDSAGNLQNYMTTKCEGDLFVWDLKVDNCGNPIICGSFDNKAIFGYDTFYVHTGGFSDGYLAKILRIPPGNIDLGPDTTVCAEYTIFGPEGYTYYSWNNVITNQNWHNVTETGTYRLACSNEEGCWLYDTISISIHPGFEINLGPDTIILENEAIVFTLPTGYESYLWSNTVTANSITIFGESYEPGTILPVWVVVNDGPCIVSDTVFVTIKSEFAVEDNPSGNLLFYPNPFNNCIYLEANSKVNQIEICDMNGLTLLIKELPKTQDEIFKINLENLNRGVYIMKLYYRDSEVVKKIVKL